MNKPQHSWNVTPGEAREIQERLRTKVIKRDARRRITRVAGVDIGFEQSGLIARAAVVCLSFPELQLLEHAIARRKTTFPYVPGLLSFRECPAALAAIQRLRRRPHVLLCDGQGYAHPRRFGLACHLGFLSGLPSVGVAKTRLIGDHEPVPRERGARVPLIHQGEEIGAVVRTRAGVKPVYVSIGHKITLARAVELVLACSPRYRLPETTRQAHRLASSRHRVAI